jgi:hypothetical protein
LTGFWGTVFDAVIAPLVVGGLVYVAIERKLVMRAEKARRLAVRAGVLAAVLDELRLNRAVAQRLLEHLPNAAIPFAGFETSGWTLVSQIAGLTALDVVTVKELIDVYVRVRAAHDQHLLLVDLTYGATGATVFVIASSGAREGREAFERFDARREDLRGRLLRRVEELEPRLAEAIRTVEGQLAGFTRPAN